MEKIAETVIKLRMATRRACMCENVDGRKKSTLSLKTKVLYLLNAGCSPKDVTLTLCIAKSNLAQITKGLIGEGYLLKSRGYGDKREARYALTGRGKKYLSDCMKVIEKEFASVFSDEESYKGASEKLVNALEVFSYLNV